MKRILFILILVLITGSAYALTYTVIDTTRFYADRTDAAEDLVSYGGTKVNELEYGSDWVSWKHHYEFNPAAISLTSASLTLELKDDGGWFDLREFGFGWTEGGTWSIGEVNTGDYTFSLGLSGLEDGNNRVTLVSLLGDFLIASSKLVINYEGEGTAPVPVPEPQTMMLLGIGLVGLAVETRRKINKKDRGYSPKTLDKV